MPHVVVKMITGRSEEQKQRLAAAIARALADEVGATERSISIAIEDVAKDDWMPTVFEPEIRPALDRLYRKPGYA